MQNGKDVPLKPLSDQEFGRYHRFLELNVFNSDNFYIAVLKCKVLRKETPIKNDQFLIFKTFINISYLIRQSF